MRSVAIKHARLTKKRPLRETFLRMPRMHVRQTQELLGNTWDFGPWDGMRPLGILGASLEQAALYPNDGPGSLDKIALACFRFVVDLDPRVHGPPPFKGYQRGTWCAVQIRTRPLQITHRRCYAMPSRQSTLAVARLQSICKRWIDRPNCDVLLGPSAGLGTRFR